MEKVVIESKWQTRRTFDTVFWHSTTQEPVAVVREVTYNTSILFCTSKYEMDKLKKKPFVLNSAAKLVKWLKKCMEGYKNQSENGAEPAQHNRKAVPLWKGRNWSQKLNKKIELLSPNWRDWCVKNFFPKTITCIRRSTERFRNAFEMLFAGNGLKSGSWYLASAPRKCVLCIPKCPRATTM